MIISRPTADRPAPAAGFTLVEILVSAAISGFILTAVLSTFLFIGRTGLRASSYSEVESETRRALDTFAQDARAAADIRWHSAQCVTLLLPAGSPSAQVTYGYDTDAGSATYRSFYRVAGPADSPLPRRALVRGVASDFAFQRFKREPANGSQEPAANDLETQQLQLTFRAEREGRGSAAATQQATSTRHLLRNKRGGG